VFSNYALVPVNQVIPIDVLRSRLPSTAGAADLRHHHVAEEKSSWIRNSIGKVLTLLNKPA